MVVFTGQNSVRDRTIFVNKGPISKKPLPIITGSNLKVLSEIDVEIPTGVFTPAQEGYLLKIEGSSANRNDGTFTIEKVLSATTLRLTGANFTVVDPSLTTAKLILLVNDLKKVYNFHRIQFIQSGSLLIGVHGTNDSVHVVTAADATDLSSAITLVNDIRTKFQAHRIDQSGTPEVHRNPDTDDEIFTLPAHDLNSANILANEIRRRYETHRQEKFYHQVADTVNQVTATFVSPVRGIYPSSLTGPFDWTLLDPQYGLAANHPYDVSVLINGSPVVVEAVVGQLGAVVLETAPIHGDDVQVSYSYLKAPPQNLFRLNSPEYTLNQTGNLAVGGWPGHLYAMSSYLMDPLESDFDFMAPSSPKRVGWKYKAIERAYSALLNDPTTLLLNVPTNRIGFPVLEEPESELTVTYDPVTFPQDAAVPWTLNGQGEFSLNASEKFLTIVDNRADSGHTIDPPSFSQDLPIDSPSYVNAAFRVRVSTDDLATDGDFTGVAFCVSDGFRLTQVGFLQSDASNLSSALFLANALRAAFNGHVLEDNVHDPKDTADFITLAPATNLDSLVPLTNTIKNNYVLHINKGPLNVHQMVDTFNTVSLPDCVDLASAITVLNLLRPKFNNHRSQPNVHFLDDINNEVPAVRQVGILTNSGPEEFVSNWNSFAIDWTQFTSYRLFRDPSGNCSIFLSGNVDPVISVSFQDLPSLADRDIDSDSLQEVIFGSISRSATSISDWQFIRLTRSPVESTFIEKNKSVEYDASVVPQLDSSNPWIEVGVFGSEKVVSGNTLLLDSSGGASSQEVGDLGLATGAFRGYTRLEPIQTSETTTSIEFRVSCDYFTHSISNKAIGVVLDDDLFTIQLAFLQFSPTPAQTTGTVSEPFNLATNDSLTLRVGTAAAKNVLFAVTDILAAQVATKINAAFGFLIASSSSGRVQITSPDLGSDASFDILGGSSLSKLGLSIGSFVGSDSNDEAKVSWFGDDLPDRKSPPWSVGGSQTSSLFGNNLRITDNSTTDYLSYTQDNPVVTNQAITVAQDWKLNFRFRVLSFAPGDILPAPLPYLSLDFAGLMVSVDEGTGGKNIQVHLAVDGSDTYINLVTFNNLTGNLDIVAQYAFGWNDTEVHSINIFTNKISNQIFVFGDGIALVPLVGPTPAFSLLKSGVDGPLISFGSGSTGISNVDLMTARSVIDWQSVNIIRDSKLNDVSAPGRRFIGLYTGGSTNDIDSYILAPIDWTLPHTYRLVRDPLTAVSVFIDGGSVPIITTSYDSLSLPPHTSSYLFRATNGRTAVAFGSFESTEISRTRWDFVNYSIGKLTATELLIPSHNVLNQHNVIVSGEHLRTNLAHTHHGFTVYSGGTPFDEFMADPNLPAQTQLNEGTPPVPMTQDLDSRGGLIKTATLVGTVPIPDFVNFPGDISNFNDDVINVAGNFTVADLSNDIKQQFNLHIVNLDYHDIPDSLNAVLASDAVSLASTFTLLNAIKTAFNDHLVSVGVHLTNDLVNTIVSPNAVDLNSAIVLANEIHDKYSAHISSSVFHITFDVVDVVTTPSITSALDSAILAVNDLRTKYLAHLVEYLVHLENDSEYNELPDDSTDLDTAIDLANGLKKEYNSHRLAIIRESQKVHITDDMSNVVSAPDATDITSLTDLLIDFHTQYEAHREAPNVHKSTVFIQIQVPPRVLYDDIKFFKTEEGDSVSLTPICDSLEETITSAFSDFPVLDLPGTELPEDYTLAQTIRLANNIKAMFNAHLVEPGVHVSNDLVNQVSLPDATDLSSLIALLNAIKTSFNDHLVEPGVHTSNNPANSSIIVIASSLGTAQALANDLRYRYEQHRADAVLHLSADYVNVVTAAATTSPNNPGWKLFTLGAAPSITNGGSSTIFGTPGLTQSAYRYDNITPISPGLDFEFSIRMRVNAFASPSGPNYDTSIYAGFTSDMAPGVAAGIGFDFIGGVPSVKIQDVNADVALARIIDDWTVAGFRDYKIIRESATDTFRLVIE